MPPNATLIAIVNKDFKRIIDDQSFNDLHLKSFMMNKTIHWTMKIGGATGTYWDRQVYDVEIQFNSKHPFEPPKVVFPSTEANRRSIKVPMLTPDGELQLTSLNRDNWSPVKNVIDIVVEIQAIFRSNPDTIVDNNACRLNDLSVEVFHHMVSYLELSEIGQFCTTSKKFLVTTYNDELWVELYYSRCTVPTSLLYATSNPGPLRVLNRGGVFVWEQSKEAYIRAKQCASKYRQVPRLESVVASELTVLIDLAYPSLSAPTGNNQSEQFVHNNIPQHQPHMANFLGQGMGQFIHNAATHTPLLPSTLRQHREAVKYRIHRSRRLLRWLQSVNCGIVGIGPYSQSTQDLALRRYEHDIDAMSTRYIVHNRWNVLPMTTIQFLCSLECNIRIGSSFEHLVTALSTISKRNVSRLSGTVSTVRRMLNDWGMSEAQQQDTCHSETGVIPSLMSTLSNFLGHNHTEAEEEDELGSINDDGATSPLVSKKQRYSFDHIKLHSDIQPSPHSSKEILQHSMNEIDTFDRVLTDDFFAAHVHPRDEAAVDILHRSYSLRSVPPHLRSHCYGHEAFEDIETFVHDHSLGSEGGGDGGSRLFGMHEKDEGNGSDNFKQSSHDSDYSTEEPLDVPDVYDFLERLHEMNIACSYWFRIFNPSSIVDCQDSSGDWLEAIVCNNNTKTPNAAGGVAVNNNNNNNVAMQNNLQNIVNNANIHPGGGTSGVTNPFQADTKSDHMIKTQAKYLEQLILLNECVYHPFDCNIDDDDEKEDETTPTPMQSENKESTSAKESSSKKTTQLAALSPYWICVFCTAVNRLCSKVCNECFIYCGRPLRVRIPLNDLKKQRMDVSSTVRRRTDKHHASRYSSSVGDYKSGRSSKRNQEDLNMSSLLQRHRHNPYLKDNDLLFRQGLDVDDEELEMLAQMQSHYENDFDYRDFEAIDDADDEDREEEVGPVLSMSNALLPVGGFAWHSHEKAESTGVSSSSSSVNNVNGKVIREVVDLTGEESNGVVVHECVSSSSAMNADATPLKKTVTLPKRSHTPYEDIKNSIAATVTPFLFVSMDNSASFLRVMAQAFEEEENAESRLAVMYAVANAPQPLVQLDEIGDVVMETSTLTGASLTRMCDYKIPIICARPRASTSTVLYIDRSYRGVRRQYGQHIDNVRSLFSYRSVPVHFRGYDSKFDESVPAHSTRLMPFRTRSSRPISMNSQLVNALVNRVRVEQQGFASVSSISTDQHTNNSRSVSSNIDRNSSSNLKVGVKTGNIVQFVEIRLRCLWLCHTPGAGLIRYSVPNNLPMREILTDYCKNMHIEIGQVRLARIDMLQSVRYALQRRTHVPSATHFAMDGSFDRQDFTAQSAPGVQYIDNMTSTLHDLHVVDNEILDVIYIADRNKSN